MHSNGCTYKLFSFSVESKTIHPDYNPATFENDIAVVRLAERVTFKEHIIPVRNMIFIHISSLVRILKWATIYLATI